MAVKRVRMKNKHRAWVKWVVAIGIVAFLGVTFAASVGIGNWLLKTAEQYPASVEQESVTVPPEKIIPVRVPAIKAYAYSLGDRYSGYVYADITHLCAPLRDADGALVFSSRVCERAGWEQNGRVDLATNTWELHQSGLYLCAFMPISGFAEEDEAVRELVLSYEASLISEAADNGVDEIFLTGLDPTHANITEVAQYLRRVKSLCSSDCAIGVMITPEVLLAEQYDVYLAAQLMSVCDFLVLDLRGLPLNDAPIPQETETEAPGETLTEQESGTGEEQMLSVEYVMQNLQYDLTRYSPRLALSEQQTDALDYIIAKGYGNWVIIE